MAKTRRYGRVNVKSVIYKLKTSEIKLTPNEKQMVLTLKKAEDAISQTAIYMSTRLECVRRHSFFDHLKSFVQPH